MKTIRTIIHDAGRTRIAANLGSAFACPRDTFIGRFLWAFAV